MRRLLLTVEVLLYILFVADALILNVGLAVTPGWEPVGGVSLIVILLLASVVHDTRNRRFPTESSAPER